MKTSKISNFTNGWVIGDFNPSLHKTPRFEVAIHNYQAGFLGVKHTHKIATEYNIIISGKLIASGLELSAGDVFVYYPDEVSDVKFLEDTTLVIVKTPSCPTDKYICE